MTNRLIRRVASIALLALFLFMHASAQSSRSSNTSRSSSTRSGASTKPGAAADSSKIIPRGLTTWRVDERFGSVTPTKPDTFPHLFQLTNFNDGVYSNYSHTGNLASPRIARIYNGQQDYMMGSQFIFARPYSMALESVTDLVFTNTKSPITNITWMSQGNKINGDDRLRVNFASNINKQAGIGAKIDYLFGRGYYTHQNTSSIASKVFGSYRSDRYSIHAAYILDRTKNAENGGLTDDTYITHPEYFSTKYSPADMPVRLNRAYNNLKINTLFFSHRYNLGFYELVDSAGCRLILTDSLRNDSATLAGPRQFIPVAAIVHTAKVDHSLRRYMDYAPNSGYYIDSFFLDNDTILDRTRYTSVENTFALEMTEGFRRWVKTGMRLFGKHQFARFTLPDTNLRTVATTFNYITIGAQLMRNQGHLFHYNVLGELRTTGEDWGEFNVEGNIDLNIPILQDSVALHVDGFVRNELPSYYYRHFHSDGAWWDNDNLSKVFRSRVEGTFRWRNTCLRLGFEAIQNHTFFQEHQSWADVADPEATDRSQIHYGVSVAQADKNIQLFSAALGQTLRFGPLVWENELTLQHSTDKQSLPLPLFNAWSNLYFDFSIAHVLHTNLGADFRYFTRYNAPTYIPFIGMYAAQDPDHATHIGNYPWVNVYANFHLKTCRFYVMYSHVNQMAGAYFLAPHYPTNQRSFRIGISWNFFN